jgi:dGTPase
MDELTDRQRAILGYIGKQIAEQRFPPTIREIGEAMGRLRKFMFEQVYFGDAGQREQQRVAGIVAALYEHYTADPQLVPDAPAGDSDADLATRVTDYLAGMTDRFCLRAFSEITVPAELRE